MKEIVFVIGGCRIWISNLIVNHHDLDISEAALRLTRSLKDAQCPVILVLNEVGTGIVPENRLVRLFRDAAGIVNQNVAACSDKVVWMVAGIAVSIKEKV